MDLAGHVRRMGVVASIAMVVGLSACGGSDDPGDTAGTTGPTGPVSTVDATIGTTGTTTTGDRDGFVAAAAAEMTMDDADLATCLAGALVDAVGMPALTAAGVSASEFARASSLEEMGVPSTLDDPAALQADLAGCGDLVEVFAAADRDDGPEADCVRDHLTNDLAAETIVGDLTDAEPSADLTAARDAIADCILTSTTATTS